MSNPSLLLLEVFHRRGDEIMISTKKYSRNIAARIVMTREGVALWRKVVGGDIRHVT